jgi:hypothetical protein
MQYARGIDRGFEVVLIYIGTESVEINLARIARVFWQVVTTFLRWTFVGAISAVFRICRPPLKSLIEFYSSTTPTIWVTNSWA